MRNLLLALALGSSLTMAAQTSYFEPCRQTDLRMPAVPLIINDPYISVWSMTNNLTDGVPEHWNGQEKTIDGLLRVDDTTYRFLGKEKDHIFQAVVPMADAGAWQAKVSYTSQTDTKWTANDFDESSWLTQNGAFGSGGEYANCNTGWRDENSDIYIRRHFTLTQKQYDDLQNDNLYFLFSHDDVCQVYINGHLITQTGETWIQRDLSPALSSRQKKNFLKVGDNVIGYHVHNTTGGAYADIGIYRDVKGNNGTILTATQNGLGKVLATSSYYNFTCGPVNLDLVFTAPMAMDDLDLISTPINYVSYRVQANDNKDHNVQIYIGMSPDFAVNSPNQATRSQLFTDNANGFKYVRAGVNGQRPLKTGDLTCIDWGYLYLPSVNGNVTMGDQNEVEKQFVSDGTLYTSDRTRYSSTDQSTMPTLAYEHDFGTTQADSSYMMIGYDEVTDVQYMGAQYKGYWARDGKTLAQAIAEFRDNYDANMKKAREWDAKIYDDALKVGDKKYAEQLSGLYRQTLGAHKLFQDKDGDVMYFSKEDNSGGFINTVDVTYPAAPLLMAYNTTLEKGALAGIMKYCYDKSRWGFTFPPHDIGFYPVADNQTYAIRFPGDNGDFGGNMPIEEAGNMLTLTTMVSLLDGNVDFASKYWDLLTQWTKYLSDNGQDPENQLCTDDFAGHSAHNTNLSLKAIMGVAGYALMAQMKGDKDTYTNYMNRAKEMANTWIRTAKSDDGKYYKRAFDNNNTWSLKYNLIWDKVWGTKLFPDDVKNTELNYYITNHMNTYGMPLDDREQYSKSDWITWIASLEDTQEGFNNIEDHIWKYINETNTRWPVSDWFWTTNGDWRGFRARSVVGGHWMRVLEDIYNQKKNATGIQSINTVKGNSKKKEVEGYYNLSGMRVSSAQKGFVIEKYTDGTARKIIR